MKKAMSVILLLALTIIKKCIALCQINKDNARETMVKERLTKLLYKSN